MTIDEATGKKFQEMQSLEQTLQSILMQKQAFVLEQEETEKALSEIKNSGDEVYKLIGQLLLKSDKGKIMEDLEKKNEILELRIKNLEKQEDSLNERLEKLREEVSKSFVQIDGKI